MNKEDFEILKDEPDSLDDQNDYLIEENDRNEESKNRRKSLCNENREEILKLMKVCLKNLNAGSYKHVYDHSLEEFEKIVNLYKIMKENY